MWVEAYLRGKFWAKIRSTQRCEGMHAYMKCSLEGQLSLVDFMKQFHKKLDGMRHFEAYEDYITQHKEPPSVGTLLSNIKRHAKSIHTQTSFDKVVARIKEEGYLFRTQFLGSTEH